MLAAAELWNLRITVVRPGHVTVLARKGERIVWLKLESRHYEFLASDNSEEFKAARRAHIKEIAEIYKVAFSKLDSVKDDCMKDLDGGAASRCGQSLEDFPSARSRSCSYVRSNERARVMCSRGTSSARLLSVCEKMSPSARCLTESKLQRIEESVSVKMARRGARSDVVSLPLNGESLGGSVASGSNVTALSKWSCAVAVVSMRWQWCRVFAGRRIWQMLLQMSGAWEKHHALWWSRRQVPTLFEIEEAACLGAWQGVANGEDTCS